MTDECPSCGGRAVTAIRTYTSQKTKGVVDVGWRCHACGLEYGFELSEASYKGEPVKMKEQSEE